MAGNCIAFDFRENEMHVEIPGWHIRFAPAMRRRPKIAFWWVLHFRYISSFAVDTGEKNISDTSHFNDFVSFSNFFEQCIFSLTSKHSLQNLKMQTFVYSFIYCLGSTSANSICESAKCAFFVSRSVCRY